MMLSSAASLGTLSLLLSFGCLLLRCNALTERWFEDWGDNKVAKMDKKIVACGIGRRQEVTKKAATVNCLTSNLEPFVTSGTITQENADFITDKIEDMLFGPANSALQSGLVTCKNNHGGNSAAEQEAYHGCVRKLITDLIIARDIESKALAIEFLLGRFHISQIIIEVTEQGGFTHDQATRNLDRMLGIPLKDCTDTHTVNTSGATPYTKCVASALEERVAKYKLAPSEYTQLTAVLLGWDCGDSCDSYDAMGKGQMCANNKGWWGFPVRDSKQKCTGELECRPCLPGGCFSDAPAGCGHIRPARCADDWVGPPGSFMNCTDIYA